MAGTQVRWDKVNGPTETGLNKREAWACSALGGLPSWL
jgi:hypothetical protein